MKNFKFLMLTVVLILSSIIPNQTQAQIDATINPINALFGSFIVGADFVISDNFSAEGIIGVTISEQDGAKYTGVPVTGFAKYYFSPKNGADRFYATAFLRFVRRSYEDDDPNDNRFYDDYDQTRFGAGFGLGYKIVSKNGIVFDVNFGVGRAFVNNLSTDSDFVVDVGDLMLVGKLGIGYRFGR